MRILSRLPIWPIPLLFSSFTGAMAQQASAPPAAAQQIPASARPQAIAVPGFDVAAIHQHIPEPHEHNSIWSSPSDSRFKAENVSLTTLIHWAFDVSDTRILGLPGWAGNTYFNIDASSDASVDEQMAHLPHDTAAGQKKKMVQALLAARFKLVAHTETHERPVYFLTVAQKGPKLGQVQDDGSSISSGNQHIHVQTANSVASLAEQLSKVVDREVIDKTGIAGRYDLDLTWTPDDRGAPPAAGAISAVPAGDTGSSIFTALKEQLGLKLEPGKGPVLVLVIDHVEMPSEN